MRKFTGFLIILLAYACASHSQHIISGKVLDEFRKPLLAVSVSTGINMPGTFTDSAGNFTVQGASLPVTISFSHVGYETVFLQARGGNMPVVFMKQSGFNLAEAVVQSFERNTSKKNIAAAVSVLDKASLERFSSQSFIPAVNTVPGVKMDERSPGSYRLSIRGNLLRSTFGVRNVKVYWNGIPFTDANGTTYLNELSIHDIGKIEILKGPAGSMYGPGTGGVVLLSSHTQAEKGDHLSFNTSAGSYGAFSAFASYNHNTAKTSTGLSFTHQQSDGYRNHTRMRRDVANLTGKYDIGKKQLIRTNIFYSDLFYQTPGGLTFAEMTKDPKQARPAAGMFNSAEVQQAALYLKTVYASVASEYRFNNKWDNSTSLYFSNTAFRNPTIRNYEKKTENGFGARTVTKYRNKVFSAVFGAEYQYGFVRARTFANKLGNADSLQFHDEISSRQFNVFVQGDYNLGYNLFVQAGVSYNNFHYGFERLNQFFPQKQRSGFLPQVVPRFSLLKKIRNLASIYVATGKGYSPPTIDEVRAGDGNFNTKLNAETGFNMETGIKADLFRNRLSLDACIYWFRLGNTIVSRRDSSGADYFVNAGKTRQRGYEVAVHYTPVFKKTGFARLVSIWVNYTNIYARFVNYTQGTAVYDGNRLTGTAPDVLALGADVETSIGIYANLTGSYTAKIPLNDANSVYGTDYRLLFVKTGYKALLAKKLTADVFFTYEKSFNERYSLGNDLNAAGNRFFNPSANQLLHAGVSLKLTL